MAENEFKKLASEEKLPPEHREAVLKSIDTLKLIGNVLDMFSAKQAKTDLSLLENLTSKTKSRKQNSDKPAADDAADATDNPDNQ